ncbi:MAG: NPCBM/NEW2 domain-containing protein, partial [Planctomycetaceae bacterium]|nr:NPCBM/NEW2 domain-containing protein [Planctomycetaceae bacterium]
MNRTNRAAIGGVCLGIWCCVAATLAAAEDRAQASLAVARDVMVRPFDAAEMRGQLIAFDEQNVTIRASAGGSHTWRRSDLRALRFEPSPPAQDEIPPVVLMANGDVLSGPVMQADEESLIVRWTSVAPPQAVTLPLESVRSFAFRQPDTELGRVRLRRSWALLEPDTDRLISTDNTHLDGELLGINDGQVRFKSALGTYLAGIDDVTAVVMNHSLVNTPKHDGLYLLVSFRDGSRLSFRTLGLDDAGRLRGESVWGTEFDFPIDSVHHILFLGDRAVPLSDLTPAKYEFTPYLTQRHPLVTNRNVHGGRLRLRGEMFAVGLGVSSKSEVTYDLIGGGYASFEAVVGVDDMTDGQGNVVFAIELDGSRVFQSKPLTGRSPLIPVGP